MDPISNPPNSPEPVKHRQLPLLAAILSLLVLSIIGALAYQNFILRKQLSLTGGFSTPSPNPTADWKTYTNKKVNYSINFPENWSVNNEESNQRQYQTYLQYDGDINDDFGGLDRSQILIIASQNLLDYPQKLNLTNEGSIKFNNLEGTLYSWKDVFKWNKVEFEQVGLDFVVKANSTNFLFRLFTTPKNKSNDENTLIQILSTFRFID